MICSQILDFWQHQEDIADVLLQASDSSHATDSFFDNIAAALLTYSSGKYHATDEQLAKCLFVLWKVLDKINGAREPIQKHWKTILLTKISTKPSLQRVWTPFGRLVGYEALLSSIMSAEECHVAYTVINCLLEERKEKEIVAMDFRDDCQTSIMAYLARNAAMYINALGLAYKEGKLNVVASLLRCGLQLLPAGVSSGEQEKTGQMVVSREEGLSHIKNLKKPAETFLLDTVLCDSDVDRVVTVLEGTGRCVRCLSSAGLEKFSDFALEACRMVFDQPERADVYLRVVVACFPVDRCSLPQSKFSMQHYDSKQVLPKGSTVWYHHRQEDRWESGAKIVDVDYSAVPPSYSVAVAGGVRETERDRLSLVDPRQSPSTQSQTVDYTTLASDQERSWLMKILKLALAREDLLGLDTVLVAVAYGGRTLSRQDWESVLNFLQRSTERLVGHLCYTVLEPVCDTVMCQAKKLAETDFNSVISAVDFFSLLSRKGILHRSTANTQAVATIMKSSESDFDSYFKLHGATLSSVLSLYCHIAATVQTSPFLPIITWESIQAQICIFIMDIYILIGKVFAIMRLCTDSHYEDGSFWANVVMDVDAFSPALQQLSTVVHSIVVQADNAFMSNVMQRADGYSKFHQVMEGINGLDALVALSLLQEPHCVQNSYSPMTPVAATAHILLFHHHKMLSYLVTDLHNGNENADVAQNDALELASKGDAQEAFELAGLNQVLALVATDPHDPQFLHAWSLITGCILENTYQGRSKVQAGLIECIRELPSIVNKLFSQLIHSMDLLKTGSSKSKGFQADKTPSSGAPNVSFHGVMRDNKGVTERSPTFAAALLYGLLRAMPTVCRGWFVRLQDRATAVAIEKYISTFVSPEMIAAEFSAIEKATTEKNQGSVGDAFTVRTIPTSREVVASLKVEEGHSLDLLVRFPMTFPLKAPEASCQKSVGVGEAMLRKWLLSIMAFLRNHNGSVAEALDLWKRNAEREFSGQEDCLICYSIIQPSNGQLPKLSCRTCRKKFHGACLYKWFHSSGKSNCPHCQSPW